VALCRWASKSKTIVAVNSGWWLVVAASVKNESAISREVNKMLFSKEGSIN
jgi:hypothetical protein